MFIDLWFAGTEYRGISCHEVNNNGYLMKTNYSNNCDPYRAPTTRISCNMGDCESTYLWHVEPWSSVKQRRFRSLIIDCHCLVSALRIAIEVNKHVKFIVKIVKHLYRLMTDFVFHISLLHGSIVTDFVSLFFPLSLIFDQFLLILVFLHDQSTKR